MRFAHARRRSNARAANLSWPRHSPAGGGAGSTYGQATGPRGFTDFGVHAAAEAMPRRRSPTRSRVRAAPRGTFAGAGPAGASPPAGHFGRHEPATGPGRGSGPREAKIRRATLSPQPAGSGGTRGPRPGAKAMSRRRDTRARGRPCGARTEAASAWATPSPQWPDSGSTDVHREARRGPGLRPGTPGRGQGPEGATLSRRRSSSGSAHLRRGPRGPGGRLGQAMRPRAEADPQVTSAAPTPGGVRRGPTGRPGPRPRPRHRCGPRP
jgi:hypothetical protein